MEQSFLSFLDTYTLSASHLEVKYFCKDNNFLTNFVYWLLVLFKTRPENLYDLFTASAFYYMEFLSLNLKSIELTNLNPANVK